MKSEQRDDRLILSDLRMGSEPDYSFRFAIAEKYASGRWHEIRPETADRPTASSRLTGIWTRLWNEP